MRPGRITTCSIPVANRAIHKISENAAAKISVTSETFGAARLAASPTAKCPTNLFLCLRSVSDGSGARPASAAGVFGGQIAARFDEGAIRRATQLCYWLVN